MIARAQSRDIGIDTKSESLKMAEPPKMVIYISQTVSSQLLGGWWKTRCRQGRVRGGHYWAQAGEGGRDGGGQQLLLLWFVSYQVYRCKLQSPMLRKQLNPQTI